MAMRDHRMATREDRTEVIDPYEPREDPGYDWEYDDEPAYRGGPHILWGRVIVLAIVLLAAFLVGRATGGSGVTQEDLSALRAERNDSQAQVENLNEEVRRLEAQNGALQDRVAELEAEEPTTDPTGEEDETTEEPAGETYVLQDGDTLLELANEFYGDPSLADYIAEANDIADPSLISAGTEITIPPDPDP